MAAQQPSKTAKPPRPITAQSAPGLGAFGGVFTPSVLTILGIILFLRHGWVVGNGGLWLALGLIALAHTVSILTSISLAAIAHEPACPRGRGLLSDFAESRSRVRWRARSGTFSRAVHFRRVLLLRVWGSRFVTSPTRVSHGLRECSGCSQRCCCSRSRHRGGSRDPISVRDHGGDRRSARFLFLSAAYSTQMRASCFQLETPTEGPGFWVLFAIFFPAVTGFTQGVSMSGDLENPGRSLPAGTFAAVGTSARRLYRGGFCVCCGYSASRAGQRLRGVSKGLRASCVVPRRE